jgi:hypothetical protein
MRSQLLVAALAAGLAGIAPSFAQTTNTDNTTTSSTGGAAADYLKGPNIQDFYTDENLKTMKSADEVKRVFGTLTPDKQAKLKAACAANEESKYADLCKNIGTM